MNLKSRSAPVNVALFAENLRSRRSQSAVLQLRNDRPCFNLLDSLDHQTGTDQRETIMNGSRIIIRPDLKA